MVVNYQLSDFSFMHVSKMLLNELFAFMETKVKGCVDEKGISARKILTRPRLKLTISKR